MADNIGQREILVCPKCGHKWFSRIIEGKIYYQCGVCKYQFKLEISEA